VIVVITEEAEADLERIGDAIAMDKPLRALSFVRELRERCEVSDAILISLPDFGKGSLSDLREKLGLPSTDGVRPVSKKTA
jgi:plasmid stabilization system protein ParE